MRGFLLNIFKIFSFDKKQFKKIIALQGPKIAKKFIEKKYLKQLKFILTSDWLQIPYRENFNSYYLQIKLHNKENFIKNCFSGFI
tara:strand:+ start:288 stop:542 length:255 start_codon:yes stop_codon:yes gene_type:complete